MIDTDMIVWIADEDKSEVLDLWSPGYTRPLIDEKDNNHNTIKGLGDGTRIFTTYRKLDTGDAQDYVVPIDQDLVWNYALRTSDEPLYKPDTELYKKHSQAS